MELCPICRCCSLNKQGRCIGGCFRHGDDPDDEDGLEDED